MQRGWPRAIELAAVKTIEGRADVLRTTRGALYETSRAYCRICLTGRQLTQAVRADARWVGCSG